MGCVKVCGYLLIALSIIFIILFAHLFTLVATLFPTLFERSPLQTSDSGPVSCFFLILPERSLTI